MVLFHCRRSEEYDGGFNQNVRSKSSDSSPERKKPLVFVVLLRYNCNGVTNSLFRIGLF